MEEVLLQSYLFLGFPASLNGMAAWRRLTGSEPTGPAPPDYSAWESRGREVCGAVYAGQYERLRANVRALHPDLELWMVVEGYGKVLGRPKTLTPRQAAQIRTLRASGMSFRGIAKETEQSLGAVQRALAT